MKKILIAIACICLAAATASAQDFAFKQGYRGNVGIGVGFPDGGNTGIMVETTHGYSFGNGLFVGGGVGFQNYGGDVSLIPLYVDGKFSFLEGRKVCPFVELRLGPSFWVGEGASVTGFYFSPRAGIDFWRLSAALSYDRFSVNGASAGVFGISIAFNF